MTILDFVKPLKAFKRYDGELGIEIETESKSAYEIPILTYWNVQDDGSLRHFGKEYVLKAPVKYQKELGLAFDDFEERTRNIKFIRDSHSTSVHLHLNFLNETFQTLGNFLTLYSLFENLLIRYSGEDRISNLFCLPIVDAEETYKNIVHIFQGIEKRNYKTLFLTNNAVKYAALNLGAFGNYGSLELRSFRGETDVKTIRTWVDIVYSILAYSRQDITPKEIMLKWKEQELKLLEEIFGDNTKHLMRKDALELIKKDNVFYAGSVAYSIKGDWRLLDKEEEVSKPTRKQLNDLSILLFKIAIEDCDPAQYEFVMHTLKTQKKSKAYMTPMVDVAAIPQPVFPARPQRVRAADIIQGNPLNQNPFVEGMRNAAEVMADRPRDR